MGRLVDLLATNKTIRLIIKFYSIHFINIDNPSVILPCRNIRRRPQQPLHKLEHNLL